MCTIGQCPICLTINKETTAQLWTNPTPMYNTTLYTPLVVSGVVCGHTVSVNAWEARNRVALVLRPEEKLRV